MKSLVIGLNFGQLYTRVLKKMGHEVITVDIDSKQNPMFLELTTALKTHPTYDTIHICTPNNTHYIVAQKVAKHGKIIFIEKPGVETPQQWQLLQTLNPGTKFIMTKNNMFRSKLFLDKVKESALQSDTIEINWINQDRIPNPGSWFTNKKLAFGGVTHDLFPHLLSIFIELNLTSYQNFNIKNFHKEQKWNLKDIHMRYDVHGKEIKEEIGQGGTYGTINKDGVYDVDDQAQMELSNDNKTFKIKADWKRGRPGQKEIISIDDIGLHFYKDDVEHLNFIELGLCPESAYENMIRHCLVHLEDKMFWNKQLEYDLWIQKAIINDDKVTIH
mgnify:CR=1 FL=1|tara:strand:- start:5776 stop:6765 length:990 start_codon:yes stop_codon:yes gene_type:complete